MIQMDTMDSGDLFAFTVIDIFTREVDVLLATDGGSEFKADFTDNVYLFSDRYRIARPYRKNEQSYVESFNRTLRKECLGSNKYQAKDLDRCSDLVEEFLKSHHYHRPHMGLNMRPRLLDLEREEHCRIFT